MGLKILSKLSKIKNLFKRKEKATIQVPEKWLKQNPKGVTQSFVVLEPRKTPRKIHITGLRTSKRVLALALLCLNFFIAQTALVSAQASLPMGILFFLNSFILLDYLWKTRSKPKLESEFNKAN